MPSKPKPQQKRPPQKSKDLPATQGMLFELRDELKAEIQALKADVTAVKADVLAVRAEVKNGVSEMKAMFHEAMLRFEAQHANNNAILEKLNSLYERQDRVETDVAAMRSTLSDLATAARPPKGKA